MKSSSDSGERLVGVAHGDSRSGGTVSSLKKKKMFLNIFLSQWEFLPWEIRVAFPQGKPAATEPN